MCAIAGIISLRNNNIDRNRETIREMTRVQAHRGPDGEGIDEFEDGRVLLGHRRLSIIDLSSNARQPMRSADGRYTITYNGEIYNYIELKQELKRRGVLFKTNSDTEVVLYVYVVYGVDGLKLLNGMFAFAIWDNYRKELIMARDRYGIKPLYYAIVNNKILFASEYKAIILDKDINRRINLKALKEYLTFQNIFSNMTLLQDISILEAGSYLRINYTDDEITYDSEKYWDYNFEESLNPLSYEECKEELDRLFNQAVRRQLVSDVEVGSYLSGGIDSGSIVAVASKHLSNLKTFTCGFDLHSASGIELAYDEREKAEYMSYLFKTEHYEMVLKAGDMERCMEDLIWHMEDPRVGQSYPNYYAAKI
nr:asparagine synthase (glutamine-hydrolyzing) [Lachnospiraceae bacterium]